MPGLNWNRQRWGIDYHWNDGGEEWSGPWGNSHAQWFGTILPRIHRYLPARSIVEIAPGHGRWTGFLLSQCDAYLGVDLNDSCTMACRERFATVAHASFATNDGLSLAMVPDGTVDFVFSFDSLVHAEKDVMENYIPQILRKLTPTGVAFLHHSNLAAISNPDMEKAEARGTSVSADVVAALVAESGGLVLTQEIVTWAAIPLLDCLTTFGPAEGHKGRSTQRLDNTLFMFEAGLIKKYYAVYQDVLP